MTKLRHEVVFAAARIMDNPVKPHLFKAQSEVMRATLADLGAGEAGEDGELGELRKWMGEIGRTRRGRGPSPVHDATESGEGVDR